MKLSQIITKINSWENLKSVLEFKEPLEKGNIFEEITKYYLEFDPKYKTKIKHVWLQKEIPQSILKKLNLPNDDKGIDLIAETHEGAYWAIQCKYHQDEEKTLSHRSISTFIALSKGIAENITYCLVSTTLDDYAKIYKGKKNIGFINSDTWNKLDKAFFDFVRDKIKGKETKVIAYKPKKHQKNAIKEAMNYFIKENNSRGKLIFPCGAGKSLTGYWLINTLKANRIIIAVPSLALVKQTLEVYLRESVANKENIDWLCVCSDESIGKNDDIAIFTQDIGIPCVTDIKVISNWMKKQKAGENKKSIIFTTYQSGRTIAESAKKNKFKFDLGILDEAHKTVGDKNRMFSHLLFDKNIFISKRIFMTATERRYIGASEDMLSMDNSKIYGETFSTLSFTEAIKLKILSDYKIITLFVSDENIKQLIEKNAFVRPKGQKLDAITESRTIASLIGLREAMDKYPISHAISFHSSIAKSKSFEESQTIFSKKFKQYSKIDSFHISGAMPMGERNKIITEFKNSKKALITNAKCLTEGIDVPNIDCVLFADPRKSTIDIVQAVGRALRWKDNKIGYVILPVFTNSKTKEGIIDSDEFKDVLSTLRALASNDERIIEYFREISSGKKRKSNGSPITFHIDEKLAKLINEKDFINSLEITSWNKLAKLSWMPFNEAKEFVRKLNLTTRQEWVNYCNSGKKPFDIPVALNNVYKAEWKGLGDFLGTGKIADRDKVYLSFSEAKDFLAKLKLKSRKEWDSYCKSGNKPENIPAFPNRTYKNEWKGMGDFLGTGKIAYVNMKYLPFNEAKLFALNLNLKTKDEWFTYAKTDNKPKNIPTAPNNTYKLDWKGWGDFLGTGRIATFSIKYRPFEEARVFARKLKLNSINQWLNYCKQGKKPDDIPTKPNSTYKNEWISWGDYLGNGKIADQFKLYRSFDSAREFARKLGLKSGAQWITYSKSDKKPQDIPAFPQRTYKSEWKGMADFLGNLN
jgi:predicted helicase